MIAATIPIAFDSLCNPNQHPYMRRKRERTHTKPLAASRPLPVRTRGGLSPRSSVQKWTGSSPYLSVSSRIQLGEPRGTFTSPVNFVAHMPSIQNAVPRATCSTSVPCVPYEPYQSPARLSIVQAVERGSLSATGSKGSVRRSGKYRGWAGSRTAKGEAETRVGWHAHRRPCGQRMEIAGCATVAVGEVQVFGSCAAGKILMMVRWSASGSSGSAGRRGRRAGEGSNHAASGFGNSGRSIVRR